MEQEKSKKNEKHILAKEGMKAISELEETVKMENVIKDNKIVGVAFRAAQDRILGTWFPCQLLLIF